MARILVIDDSVSILAFMEQVLTSAGHIVVPVSSGDQGIKALKSVAMDLIITDIYMPEMDGMEIMRSLRRLNINTPVVAISSKMDAMGMNKMVRAMGAWDTLKKPFNSAELIAVVEKALRTPVNPNPSVLAHSVQKLAPKQS